MGYAHMYSSFNSMGERVLRITGAQRSDVDATARSTQFVKREYLHLPGVEKVYKVKQAPPPEEYERGELWERHEMRALRDVYPHGYSQRAVIKGIAKASGGAVRLQGGRLRWWSVDTSMPLPVPTAFLHRGNLPQELYLLPLRVTVPRVTHNRRILFPWKSACTPLLHERCGLKQKW